MDALFFILSKSLWALLRPGTILVWAVFLGWLALLRNRRRLGMWLIGLGAFGAVTLTFLPLGYLALRPLEAQYPVAPPVSDVEGIIILGGAEDLHPALVWGGRLVNDNAERILEALTLAQAHPEAVVLFSGGRAAPPSIDIIDSDTPAGLLLTLGLEPDRLILESASRNTHDNAVFGRDLVPKALSGDWLLVTSAYHMPRAVATFCTAGWTNLVPWPTDFRSGNFRREIGADFADHLEDLNVAVKEWVGFAVYRFVGRINLDDLRTCVQ